MHQPSNHNTRLIPPSPEKYIVQYINRIYFQWIILNRLICNVNAHLWLFNRRTSVRMISFCCTFWVCAFFFSFLFCFVCEITLKKCSEKHFVSWQIIPSMNIMKWIFWCQKLHSQSLHSWRCACGFHLFLFYLKLLEFTWKNTTNLEQTARWNQFMKCTIFILRLTVCRKGL